VRQIQTTKKTALRRAPSGNAERLERLGAGAALEVRDKLGEWYQVRSANGRFGWVPASEARDASTASTQASS
jgi:uncharacterized protein YgiM (DUF1202 family)